MGRITINTPQGPATVDIAGDTISSEELDRLRQLAPAQRGQTFDYSVISSTPTVVEPVAEPEKNAGVFTSRPAFGVLVLIPILFSLASRKIICVLLSLATLKSFVAVLAALIIVPAAVTSMAVPLVELTRNSCAAEPGLI